MIIILVVLVVVVLYLWTVYNKFVTTKTRVRASIQEIGNQLKRQADLIPNLVDSVKGYMAHEKEIFTSLTEARKTILEATATNDPQMMVDASAVAQRTFGRFQALMESTPEIKAVGAITQLMGDLRDTADKIMYSRRVLIDLSADYNIMVVTFPSNLVAKIFHFTAEKGLVTPEEGEHLEVSEEEMKTPKVEMQG